MQYLEIKPNEFISKEIRNTIRVLSFNLENPSLYPVGSFQYISQFWNDIDVRQILNVKCCNSIEEAKRLLVNIIQEVVFIISQSNDIIFSNFKAGKANDEFLKWNQYEIENGYKIIDNKKFSLKRAIDQKTVINLEIWKKIGNRYVELSNFIILQYIDCDGNIHFFSTEQGDYIENIKKEVKDLKQINTFKSTKRLWLLAAKEADYDLLGRLQPLLRGQAAELYQIMSDLKTMSAILERYGPYKFDNFNKYVDSFIDRFAMIYEIRIDAKKIIKLLKYIIDIYTPKKEIINIIKHIVEDLLNTLNKYTYDYNNLNRVYPIKKKYL